MSKGWSIHKLITNEAADRATAALRLDVAAPPCASCKHWNPVLTMRGTECDGVRLCHAPEMFSDFSCHEDGDGRAD